MKRQGNVMRDYVQNVCCDRRNEINNGWTFKLNKKKPTQQSAAYIRREFELTVYYKRYISDFTSFAWHM